MNSFIVVVAAEHAESSIRLRDELRARGVSCVVLAEQDSSGAGSAASACTALAEAGIAAIVSTDLARQSAVLDDLSRQLPRVLSALPSAAATVGDLQARGWLPARSEVYTADELALVTARLQELGYA